MIIGATTAITGFVLMRKFGRLGLISKKFRQGTASFEEMEYIRQQPEWIIGNPMLCTRLGNIAPVIFVFGILLFFAGI